MRDPFARLRVETRLQVSALLTVLCLGLLWHQQAGTVTPGIVGPSICDYEGNCSAGTYTPGFYLPGSTFYGNSTSARVFLVAAVLILAFVAVRVRTEATRRLAQIATLALAAAAVLAASERALLPLVCLLVALALAAPPAWARASRQRANDKSAP